MANKIAIAGAGAMGSRIGTYLKQSGQECYINRLLERSCSSNK